MRSPTSASLCAAVVAALSISTASHAADWMQFGYDPAHTGYNPAETAISPANVASLTTRYSRPYPTPSESGSAPMSPISMRGISTPSAP